MNLADLITILRESDSAADIDRHRPDIVQLIPKVKIMLDFNQQNYAHQYDLWEHCLQTVVVFYLCAQKYIVKGVAAGAVKG